MKKKKSKKYNNYLIIFIISIILLLLLVFAISLILNKNTIVKFNNYLTRDDWNIYLDENIKEYYVYVGYDEPITLKEYSKTWQSFEQIIQDMTKELKNAKIKNYNDHTIYKSKEKNTTLIVCNNKKLFIGDYSLNSSNKICSYN